MEPMGSKPKIQKEISEGTLTFEEPTLISSPIGSPTENPKIPTTIGNYRARFNGRKLPCMFYE